MKNKDLIKKLSYLLFPYLKKMMIVFLCLIISSIVSFLIPIINQKIIDHGFVGKNLSHILSFSTLLFMLYMVNESFNYSIKILLPVVNAFMPFICSCTCYISDITTSIFFGKSYTTALPRV